VTETTPQGYIDAAPEARRVQLQQLHDLVMEVAPDWEPYMLSGMIAYGRYHYRYASGREGDWCHVALANNKQYISLYVTASNDGGYLAESYKPRLPKTSIGKSCIRIKRLADVDLDVLRSLLTDAHANPQQSV
jgi:hypothetical protein